MIKHLLGLSLICHPFLFAFAQEGYDPRNYLAYKTAEKPIIDGKLDETFWELRKIYWAQKAFFKEEGKYAGSLSELKIGSKLESIIFEVSKSRFKVSSPCEVDEKNWNITEDSRVWKA